MSTMKDYLKVIITVVITFLATSFLNAVVNKSNATQSDLIVVKTEAFIYTDKAMEDHEKADNERFQRIIDKQDFMLKYLDQRFTDLEKRLP